MVKKKNVAQGLKKNLLETCIFSDTAAIALISQSYENERDYEPVLTVVEQMVTFMIIP